MFPAAFVPWLDGKGGFRAEPDLAAPLVSVGALNPNGSTDALFSNTGPWVRCYEKGAAVLSTIPAWDGGLQAVAAVEAYQRQRSAIDPDDFRGGFAVWSGTSFSAPLFAGKVAEALHRGGVPARDTTGTAEESAGAARQRAWAATRSLADVESVAPRKGQNRYADMWKHTLG
jgi:subtilisin family serine protease